METPRESFLKIMKYEQPERMFNWNRPFGFYKQTNGTQYWHNTVERWYQEGLSPDIKTHAQLNDYFGADRSLRVILKTDVWPLSEKRVIDDDGDYETFYDSMGALVRQFKGADFETSMPEHIQFPVTSRPDWEKFKKTHLDPSAPGRDRFELHLDGEILLESAPGAPNFPEEQEIIKNSHWPVELSVGSLFGRTRDLMGLTNLSLMLYDDEALVAEMMAHLADLSLSVTQQFLENIDVPIDNGMWWEDMAYNNGPLISPKHVKKQMEPNYQRVNDILHRHDIKLIGVDSDGDLDKLIPLWLEGGINFVYPNEVAAGNDVIETRKKHGPEMRLVGGIDKRTLSKGREAIQEELNRRLPLVSQGGYFPSVAHSVPPDISLENYKTYVELHKRDCARYIDQMEMTI